MQLTYAALGVRDFHVSHNVMSDVVNANARCLHNTPRRR